MLRSLLERFLGRPAIDGAAQALSARFDAVERVMRSNERLLQSHERLLQAQIPPITRPACYVGDHRILTMTNRGDRMYLDSRDIAITPGILCYGGWEDGEYKAFMEYVAAKGRTFDYVGYVRTGGQVAVRLTS